MFSGKKVQPTPFEPVRDITPLFYKVSAVFAFLYTLGFVIVSAFIVNDTISLIVHLVTLLIMGGGFFAYIYTKRPEYGFNSIVLAAALLAGFWFISGGFGGGGLMWILVTLFYVSVLSPKKIGFVWVGGILAFIVSISVLHWHGVVVLPYEQARLVNFFVLYIVAVVGVFILGRVRERETETYLKRVRSLLNNMKEVFFVSTSDDFSVLYINPAAEKVFGVSMEQLREKPNSWADVVIPEDREEMFRKVRRGIEEKVRIDAEFRIEKKNNEIRWLHAIVVPVINKRGEVKQVAGITSDVTEHKKHKERMAEIHEVQNNFITTVTHIFNTPLAAIRFNLENILDGLSGKLPKTVSNTLDVVYKYDLSIIDRIGKLAKVMDIVQGSADINREEFSAESVLGAVISDIKKRFNTTEAFLRLEKPDSPIPVVHGDSEKIRFVFKALLENAIQYSPENGKITVTIKKTKKDIYYEVADKGIGIPEEEQKRIFGRFTRASNAQIAYPDGVGVSLYIARNFIQKHGGEIGFTSKEGRGSTFWFTVPVKQK